MLRPGMTFRARDDSVDCHLWVILSDPVNFPDARVLIVNFTSWSDRADPACVLEGGEHPAITHKTFAFYAKSYLADAAKMDACLAAGYLRPAEDASDPLLARLRVGAALSDRIPFDNQQLLREQGLID